MGYRDFFNKLKESTSRLRTRLRKQDIPQDSTLLIQQPKQSWFKGKILLLSKIRPNEAFQNIRNSFSRKSYGLYFTLFSILAAAYFLADTLSLFTHLLIPEAPPVPALRSVAKPKKKASFEDYQAIIKRNIFNSSGLIPEDNDQMLANGPARKSMLPLNLIGTVVLKDELKSMATIEDKSANMIYPVRIDDTVANKIQIKKIERLKVYFINQANGQLEYIEIIDELPLLKTRPLSAPTTKGSGDSVQQKSESHFEVNRSEVDKAVSNLQEVLQQARAIPNFENGVQDGYKIVQIEPGSIYEKLGIKNGDVLAGLNGEPINDPGKALQLFNELKTSNHLEIKIKRDGRTMVVNYDIK